MIKFFSRALVVCLVMLAGLAAGGLPVQGADPATLRITAPMLLFTKGETSVRLESNAPTVSWAVADEQGVAVRSGDTAVVSGVGTIDLATLDYGYFTLRVTAGSGDTAKTINTSLAVLSQLSDAALNDENSPFAVQTHFSDGWGPALLPTVKKVGFTQFRDGAYWNWIEQVKGQYNYSRFDTYVNMAADLDMTPLIFAGFRNPLYEGGRTPSTPEGQAAFAAYASDMINRYSFATQEIEIYNEFNWTYFNNSLCGLTADCYLPLLKANYERIKADNPNAFVVGGSTAGMPMEWINRLLELGGLQYMDAISVHPYRYPQTPEGLEAELAELRQSIRNHNGGKDKPIWITEMGWPTHTGGGTTESQQADYLVRAYMTAIAGGVERLYWYDFRNDGTDPNYNEHNFGLVRLHSTDVPTSAPKPAAVAAAVMIRQLGGLDFAGKDDVAAPAYSYRFGTGSETTRTMWSTQPSTVELTTSAPVTVTDTYGRQETFTPTAGRVQLALSAQPLFVKGSVTDVNVVANPAFQISAPAKVGSGDTVSVTLTVDGSAMASGRQTFHINGESYTVNARPGAVTSTVVQVPASDKVGNRTITADVGRWPERTARVTTQLQTAKPVEVRTVPAVETRSPFAGRLSVAVTNNRVSSTLDVDRVEWTVGEWSGTVSDVDPVPGGSTGTVNIDVPLAAPWKEYPSTVKVILADGTMLQSAFKTGFNPIEPTGENLVAPIDLAADAKPVYRARAYGGATDLSGTVQLSYSAQALTVIADVTDNAFAQTHTAPEMWAGDSLQVSVTPAMPGEVSAMTEIGAALLPSGPSVYTFRNPLDPTGATPGANLQVTRDGTVTRYVLTVPWTSLGFQAAPTVPFGLSFLFNDDDGDGLDRAGWVEWGAGIGGTKQSSLLRPVQLVS